MAIESQRLTTPELEPFIVTNVQPTDRELGAGAYGSVVEVQIPGALVAAKKLHDGLVQFGSEQQVLKWISDFVDECKLMSLLRHPHIVQFLGVCYLTGSRLPVLLMEKLETSLDSLLETHEEIPIDVKYSILVDITRGLVYLHCRNPSIAHRDLTARNVLIDIGLTAKIADLGVARIVNLRPGQIAATMTRAPGNIIYMPPEAVEEEGTTRYNTAIDIFSFGNVALFTLTQVFMNNLKPATYRNPSTRKIVGRSEIERREDYVQHMYRALGRDHPVVRLVLQCLEYDQEDRPSAVEVLQRLEEAGNTIPQNCRDTKLELIRRISGMQIEKEVEIQAQHEKQLAESQAENESLKAQNESLQDFLRRISEIHKEKEVEMQELQGQSEKKKVQINCLQVQNESLQASVAEKQQKVDGLKELAKLQQQQLETLRNEIETSNYDNTALHETIQIQNTEVNKLTRRLRSLEVQGSRPLPLEKEVDQRSGLEQKDEQVLKRDEREKESSPKPWNVVNLFPSLRKRQTEPVPKPSKSPPLYPTSMTFQWRKCGNVPENIELLGQPVVLDAKVYTKGFGQGTQTIYVYTPGQDVWDELPPPPVVDFTIATLEHQLVVVCGRDNSTGKVSDELFVWDSQRQQWVQQYPPMKQPVYCPTAIEYGVYLIVAGGRNSEGNRGFDVNILDTTSNRWIAVESLPHTDYYYQPVLIEDTLFLVCNKRNVLRAHIPTLISQARTPPPSQQSVWEVLPNAPFYRSSPIALDNLILTVGGSTSSGFFNPNLTTSIQLYNPTNKQWTNVGHLPKAVYNCCCTVTGSELLILGGENKSYSFVRSLYIAKVEY